MVVGETHHFRSCPHIGDDTLPSYIGIIISHYKDPYFTTSIEKKSPGDWYPMLHVVSTCKVHEP